MLFYVFCQRKTILNKKQIMSATVTNSIPATLNDLLVKLRILSMIERGKKINMGTMTFTDSSSWMGAIERSLSGEGRKGLMVHLNQIVQQAINAINEYQKTEFCGIIVNNLAEAKIGIQNLTTTYQSDPSIVAQIEVCISNINLQLEKNRSLLEGHQATSKPINNVPIHINNQPAFGINGILQTMSSTKGQQAVDPLNPHDSRDKHT